MFLLILLHFFVVSNVFQVQGCKRLTLQPDQNNFVVAAGEYVESRCFCSRGNNEDTEVYWQFEDGSKVPKKNNRNRNRAHHIELQNRNGATLVIPSLSKRWEGVYCCVGGQKVTESVTIKIEQTPNPTPSSSSVISSTSTATTTSHSSTTVMTTTSLVGSTSSTLSVSSRPPMASTPTPILPPPALPTIVESPNSQNILIQTGIESLTLLCSVTGERVTIYWQRDGLNVSTTPEDVTISSRSNTSQLLVRNISKQHEGTYQCIATNTAGTVTSAMATILVTGLISASVSPALQSVEVTEVVQFTCETDGYRSDQFKYQWRINGTNIDGATDKVFTISSVSEGDSGTYQCVVTNHWNDMNTSNPAQLIVTRNLPQILINPSDITVVIGEGLSDVSFHCTTTLSSHTWITVLPNKDMLSDIRPEHTESSTKTINATLAMNGTTIYCMATNASGIVTSTGAILTVFVPPPVITLNPQQLINTTVGETVMFQCRATSHGRQRNLMYHWLIVDEDKVVIDDANSNTLVISNVRRDDDGRMYQCGATNENGTTLSTIGRINVLPHITRHPENTTVMVNSPFTLYCEVTFGLGNITYQWRKDNKELSNGNNINYSVNSANIRDTGIYWCTVTNHRGEVATSQPAVVTVQVPPPVITLNPQQLINTTVGETVMFQCRATSHGRQRNLMYHWLIVDEDKVVIDGANSDTLVINNVRRDDDGRMYQCGATNENGTTLSTIGRINVLPHITRHPENTTVMVNSPFTLYCEATFGLGNITYQWRKDNKELSNGNSMNYSVNSANIRDIGIYWCTVTNHRGEVATSQPAIVTVQVPAPVITLNPQQLINTTVGETVMFQCRATSHGRQRNLMYHWLIVDEDKVVIDGANSDTLVISNVRRDDDGRMYQCGATNENGTTLSTIGRINVLPHITRHPENTTVMVNSPFALYCEANFGLGNITYQWRKDNKELSNGNSMNYSVNSANIRDTGIYWCTVTNHRGEEAISQPAIVTIQVPSPVITLNPQQLINTTVGETVMFQCRATSHGRQRNLMYHWLIVDEDKVVIDGANSDTLVISIVRRDDDGRMYQCGATNENGTTLSTIGRINVLPHITRHPENTTVVVNSPFALYCEVTFGLGNITYQWRKDNKELSNGNSMNYSVNSANIRDTGIYWCTVTNHRGEVATSQPAIVTVQVPPPVITLNPQQLINTTVGETVMFQCRATSHGRQRNLMYHWLIVDEDKVVIDGANSDTLVISNVRRDDDGRMYQCGATNENGTTLSTIGRINVLPHITRHPENTTVMVNSPFTLYCEVTFGLGNITYQWRKDNKELPNGNSMNYSVNSANIRDTGIYWCTVTNHRGEVATSQPAVITVQVPPPVITLNPQQLINTTVGETVMFQCRATSHGRQRNLMYHWLIVDEDKVVIDDVNSDTLVISNVRRDDDGRMYQCGATNENGTTLSTIGRINVLLHITTHPENTTVMVNSPFTLYCEATFGLGNITYQWRKDNKELSNGNSMNYSVNSANIRDTGIYWCTVTNHRGEVATSQPAIVTVQVPPPVITLNPQQLINTTVGETVMFQCRATSHGRQHNLMYHWLIVDEDKVVIDGANSDTLVISNVRRDDDGRMYQCGATNENGTTLSTIGRINVLPDITRHPENTTVMVNSPFTLYCEATFGLSNITYQWRKDNKELSNGNSMNYSVNSANIRDTGIYWCTVTNHRGEVATSQPAIVTVQGTTGDVRDLTVTSISDVSATVSWILPPTNTSSIENIVVTISSRAHTKTDIYPADTDVITINDLVPTFSYNVSVVMVANFTSNPVIITFTLGECQVCSKPQLLMDLPDTKLSELTFTMKWDPLPNTTLLHSFTVYYNNHSLLEQSQVERRQLPDSSIAIDGISATSNEYKVDNLLPYSTYCFWLQAVYAQANVTFDTKESEMLCGITTPAAEPSAPVNLIIETIGTTWVNILWRPPLKRNGVIHHYTVFYQAAGKDEQHVVYNVPLDMSLTINQQPIQFNLPNLTPNTSYTISVSAATQEDDGFLEGPRSNSVAIKTIETERTKAEEANEPSSGSSGIAAGVTAGLVIAVIAVVVIVVISVGFYVYRKRKQQDILPTVKTPSSDMPPPKPTIENVSTEPTAPVVTIENEEVTTSTNQPTTIYIKVEGFPSPEIQWFKEDEPAQHPVLSDGSLYILYTTLKDGGCYTVKATNSEDSVVKNITVNVLDPVLLNDYVSHKAIKTEDFASHVALCSENKDNWFSKEFSEAVTVNQQFSQHSAKLATNQSKNRYLNIVPYDHSRVVIGISHKTTGSDYINASLVDGYNSANEYIATQAPIPPTYGDFWKMIWEKKCTTVVMLSHLKEGGKVKCHQYWPSHGHVVYGSQRVTLKAVESLADYTIRVFNVETVSGRKNSSYSLEVYQFHFTMWPEHGEPHHCTPLLHFCKTVDRFHRRGSVPMVVHCSAGVDRTGTFIAIDTQLQRIKHEASVDIFNTVRRLCFCRNHMIQTQIQYLFIHKALLEVIESGNTAIAAPIENMTETIKQLASADLETGKTGFQMQFERLCKGNQEASDSCQVLLSNANSSKINANYINSHFQCKAYICAQGPVEDTAADFWQLIWEQKCRIVIMLTGEKNQETCQWKYWPEPEDCVTYNEMYTVENTGESQSNSSYIRRDFKIFTKNNPSYVRSVVQLHFQQWPVDSCPTAPTSVINLIKSLEYIQSRVGNGPITVHCSNGMGHSGTLCALAIALQCVKTEKIVDVFQTIKKMRNQKPGVVETVEQYEFIHKAVLEFISQGDEHHHK
ncbi:receptor-type tyrosine-protein phosphatase F-like isoform X2 [Dysidea avara]|uniref:receptor-type tyrosine-protein phosphatase F-like isoform X2 n=1 Tax=Dysidea avara TaxID=196820 RepID=UPI00331C48E9